MSDQLLQAEHARQRVGIGVDVRDQDERGPGVLPEEVGELSRHLVEHYGGRAEDVWARATTGDELFANLRALPGFGQQKAQIFTALLAKRLGVSPPGWEEKAGVYGQKGWYSVADIDGPGAIDRVREYKRAVKAEAKAKAKQA